MKKDTGIDLLNFIKYLKNNRNYSNNTIENYQMDINSYIDYCNINKIDMYKIIYKDVKNYLVYLYNKKYENTTISRHISALRTFYSFLYSNNKVDRNIFKYISLPKKEKKLPKYLTYEEIDLIFNYPDISTPIGQRDRLILEILYATGIRVSELCSIKLSDINFDTKTINIIGKGSKERIVYYGDICKEILELYINEGRILLLGNINCEYLFFGVYKKNMSINSDSVRNIINRIIKNVSIKKKISPHVLRHTFATHLLNEGCDILIVKELLGHSSLDTTGIYTHVSNEKLRKVYLDCHPRAKI